MRRRLNEVAPTRTFRVISAVASNPCSFDVRWQVVTFSAETNPIRSMLHLRASRAQICLLCTVADNREGYT
jgi:hypothetical protein